MAIYTNFVTGPKKAKKEKDQLEKALTECPRAFVATPFGSKLDQHLAV